MAELLSLTTLIVCSLAIMIIVRFFGRYGLYMYSVVAVIVSNLQVLKLTKYGFWDSPVALGTIVFSTTFAVDNILNEYFGGQAAKKGVWISFSGYLLFAILMKITALHPEIPPSECVNMHAEMSRLFSPVFNLFAASLLSYLIGQFADIFVFSKLKAKLKGKYVSFRSMISMGLSTFIDNCLFSLLTWVVFAEHSLNLYSLWTTYICATYIMRLMVAALCVPLVKLAGMFILEEKNNNVRYI
ncbi:MAG: queuosine precursor transporter [Holosporaceae bacterium]|jgi:uncharacterized integral membrane protein (TIGR00697 family)|nr:queuosine precursor transporter [Holosporaceae bacterium]